MKTPICSTCRDTGRVLSPEDAFGGWPITDPCPDCSGQQASAAPVETAKDEK